MDEAKLIHRLQCRRRYALDQAIEQFTPYVGAVIWRILAPSAAGREDVEEAVSDVFLALWAHAGPRTGPAALAGGGGPEQGPGRAPPSAPHVPPG